MKKKHRKLVVGAGVVVAAGVGIRLVARKITNFLMDVALDREPPKSVKPSDKDKLRGSGTLSAMEDTMQAAAEKLESSGCQTVTISAQDGTQLVGHWHQAENPKRTILAMHGWRSTWARDFGVVSDFWHGSDCNVLYAEQRGQGESGGDYMGFGVVERHDCADWARWLSETLSKDVPIYLAGVSMGATTVLMAAGSDLPEAVHGIISDCAFTSPHGIWKHVMEHNLHLSYSLHKNIAGDIYQKKLNVDADSYTTLQAMESCKVPVLFIHGEDDTFVPAAMTQENFEACAAPKYLMIVPGADHGMSYFMDKEGYEKTVQSFWNMYDAWEGNRTAETTPSPNVL